MITGKSLHSSNVVFVIPRGNFTTPENGEFSILYTGENAQGMRFVEDPMMQVKLLAVPKLGISICLEGNRLKVDDTEKKDWEKNNIIHEGWQAFNSLFPHGNISSFGFNMDIYYRFNNAIPVELLEKNFINKGELGSREVTDFGFQFSARNEKARRFEQYFFKTAAPLELITHVNHHYVEKALPGEIRLRELFEACYNDTDEVIKALSF